MSDNKAAENMDVDDKSKCNKCDFKSKELYTLKQHMRDEHRDISASVTPPPKKRMEQEKDIEKEVEIVVNKIKDMGVTENTNNSKVNDDIEVPKRLTNMFRLKGSNIDNLKVVRVGGGGKCGAKCLSIHTTGSEDSGTEIRTNINRHILEKWEIYCDSYEFPYTARVGGGNKTFANQEELMIFLMEEEAEASKMWMTHVCMQAASTMLNMNINIITTGISSPNVYRCARCKTKQEFQTENEMTMHDQIEHQRVESEEERESRVQKARWTLLQPDHRLKTHSNEKAEELTLLHEDDIHYNIIVPKGHNVYQTKDVKNNNKNKNTTIFGDEIKSTGKPSWAKITEAFRPGMNDELKENKNNCS